jgi:cytochrome oxidase Cu insertion factor (SCO1/SenC/PrrC family)
MSSPVGAAKTKARRTLLAIAAIFALPLVLAWVFTMGPLDWRPAKTVNYGVLVEPPMLLESYGVMDETGAALTVVSVAGDWFLVVLRDSACTESCMRWLQIAERIQIAVGRDTARVTLALLGPEDDTPTLPFKESRQSWRLPPDGKLIGALGRATREPPLDAMLLIVDYRGRIVLAYPPAEDGRGVLKDLKRLLRASPR